MDGALAKIFEDRAWRISTPRETKLLTVWPSYGTYMAMRREKRTKLVRLLASPQEIKLWQELAVDTDRTLSAWIRDLCNEQVRAHQATSGRARKEMPRGDSASEGKQKR